MERDYDFKITQYIKFDVPSDKKIIDTSIFHEGSLDKCDDPYYFGMSLAGAYMSYIETMANTCFDDEEAPYILKGFADGFRGKINGSLDLVQYDTNIKGDDDDNDET